jgi:guanylate kinase
MSQLSEKIATYTPSAKAVALVKKTRILVLVGPSGAGKDSLKEKLLATGDYHHIVSHTTRKPRINDGVVERDGREYHFISQAEAERMLDEQAFIEAKVYSGNLYGTSVAEIQAAHDEGKVAMTDIEVQGVAEYKTLDPNVVAVFLLPPDFQTWLRRLHRRYGEAVDFADFRRRLHASQEEIEQLLNTNYYSALVNDDLDIAVRTVQALAKAKDHRLPDDSASREVAKQLARDTQAYLAETEK